MKEHSDSNVEKIFRHSRAFVLNNKSYLVPVMVTHVPCSCLLNDVIYASVIYPVENHKEIIVLKDEVI